MPWKPGASGNPAGRPRKDRALTAILEKAGARTTPGADGKNHKRSRVVAEMLWSAVATGTLRFPDGREIVLDGEDWFDIAQFLYKHVDGPPKQALDITSDEQPLAINFVRVEGRNPTPDPSPYRERGEDKSDA